MLPGDLSSACQIDLPVKVVVFNNTSLGFDLVSTRSW
ncbi:hypothetical protein HHL24_32240 [Paraburkholderia sp. RP-4-7]|uniref:Uncharacterized protein n=1 Tax=Paraburkholderia polaris TaxID=2728848 RepID=A0A848IMU6_9BURK|nr:hypothetical protein [Paraburkholderia polaris]